jgi:AraC-like DNA-binding protein
MGPVAEAVTRAGGSLARVFRKAELPLRLIETPEQLILLKDQLALVEYAAQELDDETLPLALSLEAGVAGLGLFGRRVRAAATLEAAIERCNAGMVAMLQSATQMWLSTRDGVACWSYAVTDPARIGREKNELLAFGYMADTLKHFGAGAPLRVELPGRPPARARLEERLGCEIARGETARLIFSARHLGRANPLARVADERLSADLPAPTDLVASVEHLILLGLLEGRPSLDQVGARLSMAPRTLQRRLAEAGARFEAILQDVVIARARELLAEPDLPITAISLELGYSDPAHFARAFAARTGASPRAWRRAQAGALATAAAKS